jgi:hypothetical protein
MAEELFLGEEDVLGEALVYVHPKTRVWLERGLSVTWKA